MEWGQTNYKYPAIDMGALLRPPLLSLYRMMERYSPKNLMIAINPHPYSYQENIRKSESYSFSPPAALETEYQLYTYRGTEKSVALHVAHAPSPRGIILYSLGWKTHPYDQIETISYFQSKGFTVLTIPLVAPTGTQVGTFEESICRLQQAAFSKNALLHKYAGNTLPVFIMTHSASGCALLHAAKRAAKDSNIPENIKGFFAIAPFFDSANSSALAHPWRNTFYTGHARRHHDALTGMPRKDRAYYFVKGIASELIKNPSARPTHGQVLELKFYGQDIVKDEWLSQTQALPPQTYILSKNDPFSCYFTGLEIARKMHNAKVITCNSGHDPQEDNSTRNMIFELMKSYSNN